MAMSQKDIEELYQSYLPLIKSIAGKYVQQYRGLIDFDDLVGYLSMVFTEACQQYDPNVLHEEYNRGVDFPYYIRSKLTMAAKRYVDEELEYHRTTIPIDFTDSHGIGGKVGGEDALGLVDQKVSLNLALDVLRTIDPEKYEFFMVCLESIGANGYIDPAYVRERCGVAMSDLGVMRKFRRITRLVSRILRGEVEGIEEVVP